jgi:hypothetical protein
MKCRGKDLGMRLGNLVGGEIDRRGVLQIVKSGWLAFAMIYNNCQSTFTDEKTEDLRSSDLPKAPGSCKTWRGIDEEWLELFKTKQDELRNNDGTVPRPTARKTPPATAEDCSAWAFDVTGNGPLILLISLTTKSSSSINTPMARRHLH